MLILTPEHAAGLFLPDDAEAGRMLVDRLPIRVTRCELGREVSTALVSVGALAVAVEAELHDDHLGDIRCWCPHDGDAWCGHAAAALFVLAERDEPFGVGGVGRHPPRPAPAHEPWERTLRGLFDDDPGGDGADEPSEIALLFAVRPSEPGDPKGEGIAIRPAVRGKRGAWIRSAVTWQHIADEESGDARRRALAELEALHASRENFAAVGERMRSRGGHRSYYGGGWGAPDWIRLDAVPSRGLWQALADAHEAGVEFVADDPAQSTVTLDARAAEGRIDLRTVRGRLWVEPVFAADDAEPVGRALPVGAPTAAIARIGGEHASVATIAPLASPVGPEFDTLRRSGHVSVPADRIDEFARDFLPRLREIAPLVSSDASFEIPAAPRPVLVLAVRHADPVCRLFWEWERPGGARRARAAESEILDRVERAAGRFRHLIGRRRADAVPPARDLGRDETVEFLAEVLPALKGLDDVRVELHDEVPSYEFATEDPVVSIGVDPSGHDWFELNIVVSIQGEPVSSSALLTALAQGRTYFTLMSGTTFPLLGEQFARLRDILAEARALDDPTSDRVRVSRYQIDLWEELAEIGIVAAQESAWFDAVRALRGQAVERRDPPATFRAELRDYQRDGFSWLDFLRRHRLGGVLADDMGLGKTVQVLAALDAAHADEPASRFLVVTPTSVVGHWVSEAERFAPELGAVAIGETASKRGISVADAAADARLIVTSYAIFRFDHDEFERMGFRVLVLDEAQQVKNSASRGYAAARTIDIPTKFAVTGTPMENDLMELFAIATLVAPGLFGTRAHFREEYHRAIGRDGDRGRLDRLRSRLRPFLLRRTKEHVAPELPKKTEQVIEVALRSEHRRAYDKRFRREQQRLLGLLEDVDRNRVQILASLTTLRRHALDPSFAGVDGPSAKLEALGALLDEIVADGHRVLVFSQFTEFLGMAARVAEERGVRYAYLDGSASQKRRQGMIDRFRSGEVPAFFISLKAGGVGLTLTEADYCVLLDPWWNPAAENQAIDRTHRIGQTRPVMVYRLISEGTIEQKVVDLQDRKRKLFEDVLGSGDADGIRALTADDFRALLA
ncbi:DEAD/DEAH box helicase [Microbacterium karelineae]|uniref:DEAD/DEAH box helicase n=1 Tax=Microbacterium karelineae TaxID=2654283 RepID=UPI0012E999AF|nr:DEAD/DEAH box helicase [Microbacterium karelineae]